MKQRKVFSIIWLTIVLGLVSNVNWAQDEIILFSDDFEGGERSEWNYWNVFHEVIEVDSNRVLHLKSRGNDWGNVEIIKANESNWNWTDYAVEARINIIEIDRNATTPQFFLNIRNSPQGDNNYAGWLYYRPNSAGGGLGGSLNGQFRGISGVEQNYAGIGYPNPQLNRWHTIRLEARANEITWSLDGDVIIRAIDNEVTKGGVGFGIPPYIEYYLDDVRIIELDAQDALVDTRYQDIDCTIPEPGVPDALVVNVPSSVNARSLVVDTMTDIITLPRSNLPVIGWFDASDTPFSGIAGGTWLVLGDGSYTVKASLVLITDTALTDFPQYQFVNGEFVAPPIEPDENDAENQFEVTYVDFCSGTRTDTIQTVQINTESLMPIPYGVITRGQNETVDAMLEALGGNSGALSGVLVRIYEDGSIPTLLWNMRVAFPTDDGNWDTINITASRDFLMQSVDSEMQSNDPAGQFFSFSVNTRIATNNVRGDRTLRPGDHMIVYYDEVDTSQESNGQLGCNGIETVSEAVIYVMEGGSCKLVRDVSIDGWISTDLRALMYLDE